jgi:hypothetical protein
MQFSDPYRTIIVEPVEAPATPEPVPEHQPEPAEAPAR